MLSKGRTDTMYPPPSTKVSLVPYKQINAIEDAKANLETGNNLINKLTPQKVSWISLIYMYKLISVGLPVTRGTARIRDMQLR